ncbi:MAG TPA: LuxR C-terminal-related transcriptional regulator [Mucilaginibacter sp.]|nr:LuxR C-terminal-related transcriptional regulator [Mucilaginibacter sp.]HVW99975.1 LuxR C-terminal-related transcriptional regulator [Candidatus Babeliaceae bacterium]
MKLELFNNEANTIWKKFASATTADQLRLELELYKTLLSFFQVGDYYYVIFNIPALDLDFASKEITKVLGYEPSEFTMPKFLEVLHPDDQPYLLNFEKKVGEFLMALPLDKLMKYKIRYDFRLKRKTGEYVRILHQSVVAEHDELGRLIRSFCVHTDISHLKQEGKPVCSIIGLDGEPSYINIDVEKVFAISDELLTKREKQILTLLIDGKASKEIGEALYISKETVDRHRKNMIMKTGLKNTAELIGQAIRKGWV